MDPPEGAAWRAQLDAAWQVLAPLEACATAAGDGAVLRLLEGVQQARQAAITIEQRAGDTTLYRGVDLAKR
jgi:hypothetical protein